MAQRMYFEIIGEISRIRTIAVGASIREIERLRKFYGPGRYRKKKGVARVRFANGLARPAEIHWYEAHGIGRVEFKVKRFID